MKTIKLSNALGSAGVAKSIKDGKVMVYPTDTVYGIGCNAKNGESVKRIFEAKGRSADKPFSVIVPSKEWIFRNTAISKDNRKFLDDLLPGPYTVILRSKKAIPSVTSGEKTIGIRIPRNDFCDFIREQGILFITTSVNPSGEDPVTRVMDIPQKIRKFVDLAIDAGEIRGYGSRVFDLTEGFEIVRF